MRNGLDLLSCSPWSPWCAQGASISAAKCSYASSPPAVLVWTGGLDRPGDVDDHVWAHLGRLFFKPSDEALSVNEDDVLANDKACLELIPEDHHGLNKANVSLLLDVLLQANGAPPHTTTQSRQLVAGILVISSP